MSLIKSQTFPRVKLFLRFGGQWRDAGIGFIDISTLPSENAGESGDDKNPKLDCFIIVRCENEDSVLLQEKIISKYNYLIQEETMIIWGEENVDEKTLSFETEEECHIIHNILVDIKNLLKSPFAAFDDLVEGLSKFTENKDFFVDKNDFIGTYDEINDTRSSKRGSRASIAPLVFPELTYDTLDKWVSFINLLVPISTLGIFEASNCEQVESVVNHILENNLIPKFYEIFQESEDLDNLPVLTKLNTIFRNFLFSDKIQIFDLILSNENILITMGILEYDPRKNDESSLETMNFNHREFLKNSVRHKKFFLLDDAFDLPPKEDQIKIPDFSPPKKDRIGDTESNSDLNSNPDENLEQETVESVCEKATIIYITQYILTKVMPPPSIFEDKCASLNAYLTQLKAQLCDIIYQNSKLLINLFVFLSSGSLNKTIKDVFEAVSFLHEFCFLSLSLESGDKDYFFDWLIVNANFLGLMESLLFVNNIEVRYKVIEMIVLVMDVKISLLRQYFIDFDQKDQESDSSNETSLMRSIVRVMLRYTPHNISVKAANILSVLMDTYVNNMTPIISSESEEEKTVVFKIFFIRHFGFFVSPLKTLYNENNNMLTFKNGVEPNTINAPLLDRILSFIALWAPVHNELYFVNAILSSNVIKYALPLLELKNNVVRCAAVRFLREIIKLKHTAVNVQINLYGVMEKIFKLFEKVESKRNLLSCSLLSVFEVISNEGLYDLCKDIYPNYKSVCQKNVNLLAFKSLIIHFDNQQGNTHTKNENLSIPMDITNTSGDGYILHKLDDSDESCFKEIGVKRKSVEDEESLNDLKSSLNIRTVKTVYPDEILKRKKYINNSSVYDDEDFTEKINNNKIEIPECKPKKSIEIVLIKNKNSIENSNNQDLSESL